VHGQQGPEDLQSYHFPVYKGFRVAPSFDISVLSRYSLPLYLLDTFVEGMQGGTGQTFDWTVAARAAQYGRIMLAGGITSGNVAMAIEQAWPYAVDVNSGVEGEVGRKDRTKLKALFAAIRAAGAEEEEESQCLF
jgi:phosphoribosylanthranilate isomerase